MKFKRIFVFGILLTALSSTCFAFNAKTFWKEYNPILKKGTLLPQAGIGFGSGPNSQYKLKCPSIFMAADFILPIKDFPLSFGGEFSFKQYGHETLTDEITASYWSLLARALWHFNFEVKNLDVYAGAGFGFKDRILTYEPVSEYNGISSKTVNNGFFDFAAIIGAHYFFNDLIGAFVEAGYGFSYVKAGITFRFDLIKDNNAKTESSE